MLGLHFCARAFSSCGKQGPLFIAVRGPLTIAASLVAEHRLQTHRLQTCRLSNRGSRAQLLRGMLGLPRPGLEPMSPALAGRFSTTAPPGKPTLYTLTLTPRPSLPQVMTNLLSVSADVPILDISCKWNRTTCLLWLASFSKHNIFKVHPGCRCISASFLF